LTQRARHWSTRTLPVRASQTGSDVPTVVPTASSTKEHIVSDLSFPRPRAADRQFVLGSLLRAAILTTGTETDGRHDLTERISPPGSWTPLHLHTRYDERFWVISGSMTVWAGPETVVLRSGDFYAAPMGVPHTIQTGDDGCHALTISSPAGFAELIARAGTPAHLATVDTEFDADLFAAVAAELGDVILGPPGMTPADLPADVERR
jgi:mannose-6-phosphate isomerase-like protein (cupin superfamily)